MSERNTLIIATLLGGLGVGLGAFGAHALEEFLTSRGRTDTWDLAVQYQMIHALALLAIGALSRNTQEKGFRWSALFMVTGVACFSGSLYALCLTEITFPIVLITPLGGVLLIAGWFSLCIGVINVYRKS